MASSNKTLRIGGGSACPGDRLEPVIELIEKGNLDYIGFDSLSETELLAFEREKLTSAGGGYDSFTERRLRMILPLCAQKGIKIVGNMGAANPAAALDLAVEICRDLGLGGMKCAAVVGDDVIELVKQLNPTVADTENRIRDFGDALVSAHAYIPADGIVEGLRQGADLVMAGRVGDASIFLAPLIHEFGWKEDDWDHMAKGIVIGHLLECAAQVSGGYFADPPKKHVPNLHRVGFPIAEVDSRGDSVITKSPGSGGLVTTATCAEQLLYETHDPSHYIEADVISNFRDIQFEQVGPDRVKIGGTIKGKPKPELLKVALGVREGFFAEGMVLYGGPGALERAKLAGEVMRRRLQEVTDFKGDFRVDLIGWNSFYQFTSQGPGAAPCEVGVRLAGRCQESSEAEKICRELETIDNNGPAAIGRGTRSQNVKEVIGYYETFLPRNEVQTKTLVKEA